MIARIWHGKTAIARADDYLDFLIRRAIPDSQATPGNLSAYVLRRVQGDETDFLTLTLWESQEAIRRFAGDDMSRAKYYPEDRGFLLEFEPTVKHYEVYSPVDMP